MVVYLSRGSPRPSILKAPLAPFLNVSDPNADNICGIDHRTTQADADADADAHVLSNQYHRIALRTVHCQYCKRVKVRGGDSRRGGRKGTAPRYIFRPRLTRSVELDHPDTPIIQLGLKVSTGQRGHGVAVVVRSLGVRVACWCWFRRLSSPCFIDRVLEIGLVCFKSMVEMSVKKPM